MRFFLSLLLAFSVQLLFSGMCCLRFKTISPNYRRNRKESQRMTTISPAALSVHSCAIHPSTVAYSTDSFRAVSKPWNFPLHLPTSRIRYSPLAGLFHTKQFQCNSSAVPVQFQCSYSAVTVQFQCSSSAVPVQYPQYQQFPILESKNKKFRDLQNS